jgi:hypothetical protein
VLAIWHVCGMAKSIQVLLKSGSGTSEQARTLTGETDISIQVDGTTMAKVKVSAAGIVTEVYACINGKTRTLFDE